MDAVHHLPGFGIGDRGEIEDHIRKHVNEDAAQPEHDQMPYAGLSFGAEDHFPSTGNKLLNEKAQTPGVDSFSHPLGGLLDRTGVGQVHGHAAHVAFVDHGTSIGLEDYRITNGIGLGNGTIDIVGHAPFGNIDAVGFEDLVDLIGGEHLLSNGPVNNRPGPIHVHINIGTNPARFPVQDVAIAHQGAQRPGGITGQGKAGHAPCFEDGFGVRPLAPVGHQVADHGLDLLPVDLGDGPGDAFGVYEKGGHKVDQNAVEAVVGHHRLQAGQVMVGRARGQHVHRVAYRCLGVKRLRQYRSGLF